MESLKLCMDLPEILDCAQTLVTWNTSARFCVRSDRYYGHNLIRSKYIFNIWMEQNLRMACAKIINTVIPFSIDLFSNNIRISFEFKFNIFLLTQ